MGNKGEGADEISAPAPVVPAPGFCRRTVIVIGTSAGGVEALTRLVRELDPSFPATLFVVQHFPPTSPSVLPQILSRAGSLPALEARDGEEFLPGHIYVAPPDRHLLVRPGSIALSLGPKENRCRPAVDPLFRSAARAYGRLAIGVVLTGNLDDGTAGLQVLKAAGGVAVVQDPADASFPGMPRSALESVDVDHVVPLAQISELLLRLAQEELAVPEPTISPLALTEEVMSGEVEGFSKQEKRSEYTCPDCHGSMVESQKGGVITFRCHVGHLFSPESLLDSQAEALEQALWTALAALEESVELSRRLARRAREKGQNRSAELYETRCEENARRAELLRQVLYRSMTAPPDSHQGMLQNP